MDFDFIFFVQALGAAFRAVPRVLLIVLCTLVCGTVIGMPMALVRFYRVRFLKTFFDGLITILRGIPYLIFLLMFYLIFGQHPEVDIILVTALALGVSFSVRISEAIRGALESIGREQFDAAYSIGHTGGAVFWRVVFPQLIPAALPPLSNVFIWVLKSLPAASMIGVNDILNSALSEATINYRYLEAYLAAGLLFWVLFIIAEKIFLTIEKNFLAKTTKAVA
ncbi:MAG: ABC transporter permease subunit [Spirochaetaceae bacterium]|jgi:L-cystine transport system permease protein|nr:ABC transporter permease subunit [Spirochaetaceae bacterium]